jgi:FkbM family methyltransferase
MGGGRQGERESYALNCLDFKLRKYCDFENGFFVEAGANDGIRQSNTLYFEKYLGWRGLLIEAVPELARACAANRPACRVENAALVSAEYAGRSVPMRYCNLMSVVAGAMKTPGEEDQHIERGCRNQNVESYALDAPARTLTSILRQHGIEHIDLLSLDIEGYELAALQGIDFYVYKPRLMLIEARYRREIDDYLAPLYEPVALLSHHDVLYRLR